MASSPWFGTVALISVTFCLTVTDMDAMTNTDLPPLAAAVTARLKKLGKWNDLTVIAKRSEVSDNTWRPLLKEGVTPKRRGTRVAIARYLQWEPDALAMLQDGVDPQEIADRRYDVGESLFGTLVTEEQDPADTAVAVSRLEHEVAYLKRHATAVDDRLDDHDRQLGALAAVPAKLDQVLAALTPQGGVEAAESPARTPRAAPRARSRKPRAAGGAGPAA